MTIRASFPSLRPSLDLNFARTKRLDPRITFSRTSTATYVDAGGVLRTAAANEARFDHNPTTGESLGLLVEESRTNLLLRSEEFDNASWAKLNGVTVAPNAITAPNGTTAADKIIEAASLADKPMVQLVNLAASATYTASLYIKAAERPTILLHVRKNDYSTRFGGYFNTSTNTFTPELASGGVLDSFAFSNVGGGWYRCSITGNIGANTAGIVTIYIANSSNSITYSGDGTSGIYIWGAQLEQGSFPTSYIKTEASTATRAADTCSLSGSNFSSWYRQDEGTMLYDGTVSQGLAAFPWFYNISDGTINNSIGVYQFTNGIYGSTVAGGVAASPDTAVLFSPTPGSSAKHALATKASDSRAALGGTLSSAQSTTVMPAVNTLSIGQRVTGNRMTGHIRRLAYWGQRLPNSVLQTITQ